MAVFAFRRRNLSLWFSLLLLTFTLIGLAWFGVLQPVREGLAYLLRPITRVAYISRTNLTNVIASLWELGSDPTVALQKRVALLENSVVDYENLKNENAVLRAQLGLSTKRERQYVLAQVVGENPDNFSRTLLLNVGSTEGVLAGMPVVQGEVLVGRISAVHKYTSELQLLTDPGSIIQVYLQESGAKGLLQGSLGLKKLSMTQVSKDEVVAQSEHVLTVGVDLNGVKDLLAGTVSDQQTEDKATYQTLGVEPGVDLNTLEYVFIIKN